MNSRTSRRFETPESFVVDGADTQGAKGPSPLNQRSNLEEQITQQINSAVKANLTEITTSTATPTKPIPGSPVLTQTDRFTTAKLTGIQGSSESGQPNAHDQRLLSNSREKGTPTPSITEVTKSDFRTQPRTLYTEASESGNERLHRDLNTRKDLIKTPETNQKSNLELNRTADPQKSIGAPMSELIFRDIYSAHDSFMHSKTQQFMKCEEQRNIEVRPSKTGEYHVSIANLPQLTETQHNTLEHSIRTIRKEKAELSFGAISQKAEDLYFRPNFAQDALNVLKRADVLTNTHVTSQKQDVDSDKCRHKTVSQAKEQTSRVTEKAIQDIIEKLTGRSDAGSLKESRTAESVGIRTVKDALDHKTERSSHAVPTDLVVPTRRVTATNIKFADREVQIAVEQKKLDATLSAQLSDPLARNRAAKLIAGILSGNLKFEPGSKEARAVEALNSVLGKSGLERVLKALTDNRPIPRFDLYGFDIRKQQFIQRQLDVLLTHMDNESVKRQHKSRPGSEVSHLVDRMIDRLTRKNLTGLINNICDFRLTKNESKQLATEVRKFNRHCENEIGRGLSVRDVVSGVLNAFVRAVRKSDNTKVDHHENKLETDAKRRSERGPLGASDSTQPSQEPPRTQKAADRRSESDQPKPRSIEHGDTRIRVENVGTALKSPNTAQATRQLQPEALAQPTRVIGQQVSIPDHVLGDEENDATDTQRSTISSSDSCCKYQTVSEPSGRRRSQSELGSQIAAKPEGSRKPQRHVQGGSQRQAQQQPQISLTSPNKAEGVNDVRFVRNRNGQMFRMEVLVDDRWTMVVEYRMSKGNVIRTAPWSPTLQILKIDLPLSAAAELAHTDLERNWQRYYYEFKQVRAAQILELKLALR